MWQLKKLEEAEVMMPFPEGKSEVRLLSGKLDIIETEKAYGFGVINIPSGGFYPEHSHLPPEGSGPKREEIYYALSGRARVTLSGQEVELKEGSAIYISPEVRHSVHNKSGKPFTFLFVSVLV